MTDLVDLLRSGKLESQHIVLGGVEHDARCLEAADKIEGLVADLESAVRIAYLRGAKEWTKMNYPDLFKRWNVDSGEAD